MGRTSFAVDEDRLGELEPLMDDYGVAEDPAAEWPNNVLSKRTRVYESGTFAKLGRTPRFDVDEGELALCRRISAAAKGIAGDMAVGLGSESSDPFLPFFVAANLFDPMPTAIDPAFVAGRFAGTLFPAYRISVEPLSEAAGWWGGVEADLDGADGADGADAEVAKWRGLLAFFAGRADLVETAFVAVGTYEEQTSGDRSKWPPGTALAPCVLPRLLVGLTGRGSLCGLLGWTVQT